MKLRDAVKRIDTLLQRTEKAELSPEDKIAMAALVTMGKRLLRARRALKVVMLAVSDEEHLNQTELAFGDGKDPES